MLKNKKRKRETQTKNLIPDIPTLVINLKTKGYTEEDLGIILEKVNNQKILFMLLDVHDHLTKEGFERAELIHVAKFMTGDKNLKKLNKYFPILKQSPFNFSKEDVLTMAMLSTGHSNLEAVVFWGKELLVYAGNDDQEKYAPEDIKLLAQRSHGYKILKILYSYLRQSGSMSTSYSKQQIMEVARTIKSDSMKNLEVAFERELRTKYGTQKEDSNIRSLSPNWAFVSPTQSSVQPNHPNHSIPIIPYSGRFFRAAPTFLSDSVNSANLENPLEFLASIATASGDSRAPAETKQINNNVYHQGMFATQNQKQSSTSANGDIYGFNKYCEHVLKYGTAATQKSDIAMKKFDLTGEQLRQLAKFF